ncbi:MAG TPA: serine hydrolase domain-containing protein [Longimicrobiales bacterium]|nr:serine hydrolase domain-containing protein [Longimicrobiales bacterium]
MSQNHRAIHAFLAALLLVASAGVSHGQAPAQARVPDRAMDRATLVSRLDSIAGAPVQEGRAAGISVAIVHGRDTLLLKGYGKANVELDVPMPAAAVHEIGSVTKQFTAAAILQLRDEGRLSLDDDLTKYFPDYPTGGRAIPVRRLLDHTSGIKGITELALFGTLQHRGWPRDSAIALFARAPFEFPTGDAMIYNNSAYILLGHIIEQASGMSYEQYVEEKIFATLGMDDSSYCDNHAIIPNRASGYQIQGTNMRRAMLNDHTWPYSAGSLCSSAGDLVKWLQALHGGRVLTPRSYVEMTTPARLNDGTPLRYGMALAVGPETSGTMMIGHGGAIGGFGAQASWYPEAELAVVVLINSNGPVSPGALAGELAFEIIPPTLPPFSPRFFTGDAAGLVGRYAGPSRGREMVVEVSRDDEGRLVAAVNGGPAQPMPWIEGWQFGRPGATLITFEREGTTGTTGPATLLRWDAGSGYYMLRRAPE